MHSIVEIIAGIFLTAVDRLFYFSLMILALTFDCIRVLWKHAVAAADSYAQRPVPATTNFSNDIPVSSPSPDYVCPTQMKLGVFERAAQVGDVLKNFEMGKIQVVPLENVGFLTLVVYEKKKFAKRKLSILNQQLATRLGIATLKMANLSCSDPSFDTHAMHEFIFQKSVLDVETQLNGMLSGVVSSLSSVSVKDASDSSSVQSMQNMAQTPIAEPVSGIKVPEKPVPSVAPVVTPVAASPKRATPKGIITHTGMFAKADFAMRGAVGKEFKQFYVEFCDDSLNGGLNRVWGAALKDLVTEKHLQPGQHIKIVEMGKTKVSVPVGDNGKTELRSKNVFEIELI